jgi:hypothetical protein
MFHEIRQVEPPITDTGEEGCRRTGDSVFAQPTVVDRVVVVVVAAVEGDVVPRGRFCAGVVAVVVVDGPSSPPSRSINVKKPVMSAAITIAVAVMSPTTHSLLDESLLIGVIECCPWERRTRKEAPRPCRPRRAHHERTPGTPLTRRSEMTP